MYLGQFASTTARNAVGTTEGDVQQRNTCSIAGTYYEAVAVGVTSSCWKRIASSGAWTGAAVAGTNIASIGNVTGTYLIVGDQVHLSGSVASVDPTAGAPTASDFEVPIPVASNFAATTDAGGTAASAVFYGAASGSIANDRLVVAGTHTANTTGTIGITASYTIL
jgi:hypothetical protein